MKLRKLHIEDYKMFKDFDISFVDDNDEALPIVVLAGVNGSGKSTLFEFILSLVSSKVEVNNFIDVFLMNSVKQKEMEWRIHTTKNNWESEVYYDGIDEDRYKYLYTQQKINEEYTQSLIFFPSGIDETKKVAKEFVKTFYFYLKEKDYRPSEITEHFHNYMKNIFDDLDIDFKYSHLDKDDNVWFSNGDNEGYYYTGQDNGKDKNIFTIDELSTGEKTLLSKIMYLYFKDYKNQVILIDEPELSLHPSWQNKVLKIYENFAEQNNCQIIIATHSPHIIGSAKNEYLRILRKNEEGNVEVVSGLKAHGRDINSILFDVMGEVAYRPREFDEKIDRLHIAIDDKKMEEAQKRLEELKKDYGEDDEVVMEAQMLIDMFRRDDKEL